MRVNAHFVSRSCGFMTPRQLPSRGRRCVPSTPVASPAEDRSRLGARAHLGLELGRAPIDGPAALDRHRSRRSVRHGNRRSRVARADSPTIPFAPRRPLHVAQSERVWRDGAVGEVGHRARGAQPVRRRTAKVSGVAGKHSRSRAGRADAAGAGGSAFVSAGRGGSRDRSAIPVAGARLPVPGISRRRRG